MDTRAWWGTENANGEKKSTRLSPTGIAVHFTMKITINHQNFISLQIANDFFCFSAVVVLIPCMQKTLSLKNFHSFLWLTGSLAFCSTPNRRHPLGDFFSCIWRDLDKLCVLLRPLGVFFGKPGRVQTQRKIRFYELIEKSITKQFSLQAQALSFFYSFCFLMFHSFGILYFWG